MGRRFGVMHAVAGSPDAALNLHSSSGTCSLVFRGFLPWRLSDAGSQRRQIRPERAGLRARAAGVSPGVRGRPGLLNSGGASPEVVSYIRGCAAALRIDPGNAIAVASTEGLRGYRLDRQRDRGGDQGTSFGSYQLHYRSNIPGLTNAGMGDDFTKATGKHASDKSTWKEQVDFALKHAARNG
ncbi:hypothetical protein [Methylobacterium sp. 17Sr1-1]|uniref:hypothetical protein n=1 Tax=Methylobacterium sp. 17Sr1-1 TaxID=2202826 RepID=UPI000D6FD518|nr:hypothetical protein [Methylobacterium sp. 17Sr1-1]AWN52184.1 hypothetical protein DK412_11330 [Methylobacterium sp. 17Sr1-1]